MKGTLLNDWRVGVRVSLRQPGLAAAAIVALAMGVGLPTFLFSLAYGILFRGLPLPDGRRVMAVTMANVATGQQRLPVTVHELDDWRASQRSFEDLAAFQYATLDVVVHGGKSERLRGALMTANGFELLGAQPLLGRVIAPADGKPGAPPVLLLGYGAWTVHFGGDRTVIGRSLRVNGQPATVVGVMPRGFGFPQSENAWMVLHADPLQYVRGKGPVLVAYGRLRAGMSRRGAQADLGAIAARQARAFPETNRDRVPVVGPYTQVMSGAEDGVRSLMLTIALAFGVLLVACANVANLLFARAAARTQEMAIRTALGATRRRLITQLLLETCVLAVAGTALGLVIAYAGIWSFNQMIINMTPPFWVKIQLDLAVLAFAAGLTVASAAMSGAVPAWRASRANVDDRLRDTSRSGSLRIGRLSRVLVAGEMVVSFALLVIAGLMIRSLVNLGAHDYGVPMNDVLVSQLVLPEDRYPDAASRIRLAAALTDRLAALPGVQSVTAASALPGLSAQQSPVTIEGRTERDSSRRPLVSRAVIDPRFFATFGRTLIAGRGFTSADTAHTVPVAIVNASFAARFMPGADPVGSRIRFGDNQRAPWLTVVGMAPDLYLSGAENREPAGVYVPLAQNDERIITFAVRASRPPSAVAPALRAQIAAVDAELKGSTVRTLRDMVDGSMWSYRVFGPLLVVVGIPALFLASVGLYSLMAFAMRQRAREIGLRMALGARPMDIARLVTGQVAWEVGGGLLGGALLARVLARAMQSAFFHVQPGDPATYAAIAVTLVTAATLAACVPVRRAIRVDPTVTLRGD